MSCSVTTSKGTMCKKIPRSNMTMCMFHFNRHNHTSEEKTQCQKKTMKGIRCKNLEKVSGCGCCWRHISDGVNLCNRILLDNGEYTRCSNIIEYGSRLCYMHNHENLMSSASSASSASSSSSSSSVNLVRSMISNPSGRVQKINKPRQKCVANEYKNDNIIKCNRISSKNSKNKKYCSKHAHKYRLDKEPCSICMTEIDETTEAPLSCGHWTHLNCLRQWTQQKCPICRIELTEEEKIIYRPHTVAPMFDINQFTFYDGDFFSHVEREMRGSEVSPNEIIRFFGMFPIIDLESITNYIRNPNTLITFLRLFEQFSERILINSLVI